MKIFRIILTALYSFFIVFGIISGNVFAQNDSNKTDGQKAEIITNQSGLNKFQLNTSHQPEEIIKIQTGGGSKSALVGFLTFVQKILLQVVLPLVSVGCGIYIAYELFTANGDESKLKTAWSSILYSIIAIISIALSAFIVSLISQLNIG